MIRVPLELDRRIFTPIARCSPKWEKAYNRRSSVERVNSRIDKLLGFERGCVPGPTQDEDRCAWALGSW